MDLSNIPNKNLISGDSPKLNSSVLHDHNYLEDLSDVSNDCINDLNKDNTMVGLSSKPSSSVVINDVFLPNVMAQSNLFSECDQIIDSLFEKKTFSTDTNVNDSLNTLPQEILNIIFDAIDSSGEDSNLHRSDAVDDLNKN